MINRPTLRKRRPLGELISDSFSLTFGEIGALLRIVAPALLITIIFELLSQLPDEDDSLALSLISFASLPFLLAAQLLVTAGVAHYLTALDQGTATAGDAIDAVQDRLGVLMLTELKAIGLIMLVVVAGTIVAVIASALGAPGLIVAAPAFLGSLAYAFYRAIGWLFAVHSIMLDGQTSATALGFSAALVKNEWWSTFGRSVMVGLVVGIPVAVLSLLIAAVIPGVPGILISSLPGLFSNAFFGVAATLMYYDLKTKKAELHHDYAGPA